MKRVADIQINRLTDSGNIDKSDLYIGTRYDTLMDKDKHIHWWVKLRKKIDE